MIGITRGKIEPRKRGKKASRRRLLAICGGGNGGHALAVAASQNFDGDIAWLTSCEEKAELLRRGVFSGEGLRSTGRIEAVAGRIRTISSDAGDVIPDADVVMIVVPAYAHAAVLQKIRPYLKDDALIGALPARSGFEYEARAILPNVEPNGRQVIFGLQTLPWATRVREPGKWVNFSAVKARVLMATMPSQRATDVAPVLSQILGVTMAPTRNFLNVTLGNPGQVIHPGLMYALFGSWSGMEYAPDAIPKFYADTTDEVGTFMEQLSADVTAVARKLQARSEGALDLSGVNSLHDWLCTTYPAQFADPSSVATCFRTGPSQATKAPMKLLPGGTYAPDFAYRYLSEDVPYGLVVVKALAELAEIGTPVIDGVVDWAQRKLARNYLSEDATLSSDTATLPIPQNYGVGTVQDLIQWYAPDESAVADAVGMAS